MSGMTLVQRPAAQAVAQLPFRVARRVVRELRNRLGATPRKRWKRNLLFPIRNTLLRGKPIAVELDGVCVLLAPQGATAADFWAGLWFEKHALEFLLSVLEPGMTVFDIGANAGLFAVAAAKKTGRGSVYAFEPGQCTFRLLEQNLRLNGVTNVVAIRTTLGDKTGEAVLQVNAASKDELNTGERATNRDSRVVGREKVPVTALDAFVGDRGIARVDAMKVDVEGAELPVFRGARKLLERRDAPLILYEGYGSQTKGFGYHPVETMWLLGDCGYSLFVLDTATGRVAPRHPGNEYDATVVAVKPEHPSYRTLTESAR